MLMDTAPAPHRGHESPAHESLAQQQRRSRAHRLGREVRPRSDPPARHQHGVASRAGVGAPPNRYQPKIARSYPLLLEVAAGRGIRQHIIESQVQHPSRAISESRLKWRRKCRRRSSLHVPHLEEGGSERSLGAVLQNDKSDHQRLVKSADRNAYRDSALPRSSSQFPWRSI
jgi:hypothetical protein